MVGVGSPGDAGGMSHTESTLPPRRRPQPRWWAVALVEAGGVFAACYLFLIAFVMLPEYGFFGVENDETTRRLGALAAVGFGPAVLSGPLLIAAVRRDPRWAWAAGTVAVGLSTTLLLVASAA